MLSAAVSRLGTLFADFGTWKNHSWLSHPDVLLKSTSEAIEAYNLFQTSQQTRMLPMALYMCCHIPIPHLLEGFERADGTLEQLSPADLQRCLAARETLLVRKSRLLYGFYNVEPPHACLHVDHCRRTVHRMRDFILRGEVPSLEAGMPTFTSPGLFRMLHKTTKLLETSPEDLCAVCTAFHQSRAMDLPRSLFMELPGLLGVGLDMWPPLK